MEFDAPDELLARGAAPDKAVTAFQVGFFTDATRLVRWVSIARKDAQILGGTVRITVPLVPVLNGQDSHVSVRVRAMTAKSFGEWSSVAGSVDLPTVDAPSESRRRADRSKKEPGRTKKEPGRTKKKRQRAEPPAQ